MGGRSGTAFVVLLLGGLAGSLLPSCSCNLGPRVLLVVNLQTDIGAYEFERVRVRVGGHEETYTVDPGQGFLSPRPIAELRVSPGNHHVSAELLDSGGMPVAQRLLIARVVTDTSVVVWVSSLCRGVRCDDPSQTCIRGRCVDALTVCDGEPCDPESRTECPDGACDDDCDEATDCSSLDACTIPECRSHACVGVPDPEACEPGLYCVASLGCVSLPPGVDGGPREDGTDGSLPPSWDGGGCEGTCATACGSVGTLECPTGQPEECVPPEEMCTGRDDDCDGSTDEGLTCSHTHPVICDLDGMTVDAISGGGPSAVCAGGSCASGLTNCRTLPGFDGHAHAAYLGGGTSLTFGPSSSSFSPGGTSTDNGHSHSITCTIFDGTPPGVSSGSFYYDLDDPGDPLRYAHFCTGPEPDAECRSSFGGCTAE